MTEHDPGRELAGTRYLERLSRFTVDVQFRPSRPDIDADPLSNRSVLVHGGDTRARTPSLALYAKPSLHITMMFLVSSSNVSNESFG